ncbi:TBPIP-domain-containing protein [Irpex rosettiformis]|uniref:TBPIP-domain-containing protein n=1 Tax=Irpex rosettiformis TaxID=378272 RepID=A0ACB8U9A9_9APHY|nr:TBPIP-domain-containing protein [Irpex rosettiformis]
MATKAKTSDAKVPVLKGQEAEDKVLEYIKRMNRPFGAVDVAANLKGAVPKTATQKILVSLAEKGELVQKTYGKTTFFVANQANIKAMPAEKLKALEDEHKVMEETNKALAAEVKAANAELVKLKATPTDEELEVQLSETASLVTKTLAHLEPLRSGTSLVSAEDLASLDNEWTKWRGEWVKRKRVFATFWALATEASTTDEANALSEDLGIETDTSEHAQLEKSTLCVPPQTVLGKRRR